MDLWETHWKIHAQSRDGIPTDATETLRVMESTFPNILLISVTMPVTSCECERSVSVLRRLKTYMSSTITNQRLNDLALMQSHYDIQIDYDAVIDIFANKHPRRLRLVNILDTNRE